MTKTILKQRLKGLTGGARFPVGSFTLSARMRVVIRLKVFRTQQILDTFKINLS